MTRLEELYIELEELQEERNEWISMDEFDEYMSGYTPMEIAQKIFYGDFRYMDYYFRFNAYANIETCLEYDIEVLDEEIASIENEIAELEDEE